MKQKLSIASNIGIVAAVLGIYYTQMFCFTFQLKCVCSGLIAVLAAVNLTFALITKQKPRTFAVLMALGLGCAVLGDVLIQSDFLLGAASFAAGHLCFLAAYCVLQRLRLLDLALGGGIFLFVLLVLLRSPGVVLGLKIYKIACCLYALLISLMLGKAISLLRKVTPQAVLIAAGALLFCCSDILLFFYRFAHAGDWASRACLATYYPALCLLAVAMSLPRQTSKEP